MRTIQGMRTAAFGGRIAWALGLAICMAWSTAQVVRGGDLPARAYIEGVVGHAQALTLSCESRSAVDWAAYWGVKIGEKQFLHNLPRADNPDLGFVGSPNGIWGLVPPDSYGVHAAPVAKLLQSYGLEAQAHKGLKWDDLRAEIAAGRPVIVWVVGQMWKGVPREYKASDGEIVRVASFEHTMILVGYNRSSVQLVDAYTGSIQTYPLRTFLVSWNTLGNMAVTGGRRLSPAWQADQHIAFLPLLFQSRDSRAALDAPAAGLRKSPSPAVYRVRRGDYLTGLARQFGLDWRLLAEHNGIGFPYTIYPGQVLKIP